MTVILSIKIPVDVLGISDRTMNGFALQTDIASYRDRTTNTNLAIHRNGPAVITDDRISGHSGAGLPE